MVSGDRNALPLEIKAAPRAAQPRLGIVHLLVWMLFSGLWLSQAQRWQTPLETWGPGQRIVFSGLLIAQAMVMGAALGGFALWIVRLARGPRFPDSPAQDVLWVAGVSTVATIAVRWITGLTNNLSPSDVMLALAIHLVILELAALYPLLAVPIRRWRVFWLALLTSAGGHATFIMLNLWYVSRRDPAGPWAATAELLKPALDGLLGLLLIGVVILEARSQRKLDWLSWLGIGVWLGNAALSIVLYALHRLWS